MSRIACRRISQDLTGGSFGERNGGTTRNRKTVTARRTNGAGSLACSCYWYETTVGRGSVHRDGDMRAPSDMMRVLLPLFRRRYCSSEEPVLSCPPPVGGVVFRHTIHEEVSLCSVEAA